MLYFKLVLPFPYNVMYPFSEFSIISSSNFAIKIRKFVLNEQHCTICGVLFKKKTL